MSELGIPKKLPQSPVVSAKETSTEVVSLSDLPTFLQEEATSALASYDSQYQEHLKSLETGHQQFKNQYLADMKEVYELCKNAIEQANNGNKKMKIKIPLGKDDPTSFQEWADLHPGKWKMISRFLKELKNQGWHPQFSFESHGYGAFGTYSRGGSVSITCSFN